MAERYNPNSYASLRRERLNAARAKPRPRSTVDSAPAASAALWLSPALKDQPIEQLRQFFREFGRAGDPVRQKTWQHRATERGISFSATQWEAAWAAAVEAGEVLPLAGPPKLSDRDAPAAARRATARPLRQVGDA